MTRARGIIWTRVALIVGAGDGNGAAIARRFAREGYYSCVVRRTAAPLTVLVAAIEALHPDEMSPRDALEALYALKARLAKGRP